MDKIASLPPAIASIVLDKATEHPFTGEYTDIDEPGTYLCRRCGLALFRSQTKFHSGCGWASFDGEIPGTVECVPDADGQRTEICCNRCHAHLGHVFSGERFTDNNIRHCVNSLSLDFVKDQKVTDTCEAIFAAGCFWGVEYYFKKKEGVLKSEVGYTGGQSDDPRYEEVCSGYSGHYEAIRVIFDPARVSYAELTQYFFEIHDPTQINGQGPDHGAQYSSVIFYYDSIQQNIAKELIDQLQAKGLPVVTKILPVMPFFRAELYHQDYYLKTGKQPYCHRYTKRF